jgi:hypothetical protein
MRQIFCEKRQIQSKPLVILVSIQLKICCAIISEMIDFPSNITLLSSSSHGWGDLVCGVIPVKSAHTNIFRVSTLEIDFNVALSNAKTASSR